MFLPTLLDALVIFHSSGSLHGTIIDEKQTKADVKCIEVFIHRRLQTIIHTISTTTSLLQCMLNFMFWMCETGMIEIRMERQCEKVVTLTSVRVGDPVSLW